MATIGSLAVKLGLNGANFNSGLDQASNRTRRFSREVEQPQSGLSRLKDKLIAIGPAAIAVGTALAGIGLARTLRAEISEIDKVGKLSTQLGVTTEKLIGLRHAAELSGVGAESMDKAMAQLSKRLGEGTYKTTEVKDAMEHLGLGFADLTNMPLDQALYKIADAMKKEENQATKNAIATNFFGRSGQGLVNTLAQGSEGLRRVQEDAEKLGMTFSNVDAGDIAEANDALYRMGAAFKAIKTQLAIGLAPVFELFADTVGALGPYVTKFIKDWAQGFRLLQADALRASAVIWKAFRKIAGDTEWRQGVQEWLQRSLEDIEARIAAAENPTTDLRNQMQGLADDTGDVTDEVEKLKDSLDFRPKLIEAGSQEFYDAMERFKNMQLGNDGAMAMGGARSVIPDAAEFKRLPQSELFDPHTGERIVKELETISSESKMTRENTRDTARRLEELELPAPVEM